MCDEVRAAEALGEVLARDVRVEDERDIVALCVARDGDRTRPDDVAVGEVEIGEETTPYCCRWECMEGCFSVPRRRDHIYVCARKRLALLLCGGSDAAPGQLGFEFEVVEYAHCGGDGAVTHYSFRKPVID